MADPVILRPGDACMVCGQPATCIAHGRLTNRLGVFCDTHADEAANEGNPEYVAGCPNCGCSFGVN